MKLLLLTILLVGVIIVSGCTQTITNSPTITTKLAGQDCSADNQCQSGVCDFVKQDFGKCALVNCTVGSQAQGVTDISFYCDQNSQWKKIKVTGESCNYNYECFKKTGKDCPSCHPEDYKYFCKNNICVEEKQQDQCEKQGLKRITSKEDADNNGDGTCFPTLAQRAEITVCAPCGNGACDTELESKCNCAEDCK